MSVIAIARRPALGALVFAVAVVLGCTSLAQKGAAEGAVNQFHERLDAGSYDQIYDSADDRFKAASTREQFTKVLRAIHDKLGKVTASKQTGFSGQDRAGTDAGSYLQLVYETQFATGKGTETFMWRVDGGQVRLFNYNINSADLITK